MINRYVTWKEIEYAIQEISKYLYARVETGEIKNVYGVPRGGLIPAVLFSHRLKIPLVFEIGWNTLVVDDITDRGSTLKQLDPNISATLFFHKDSKFKPTFTCFEKADAWIVFPWETKP